MKCKNQSHLVLVYIYIYICFYTHIFLGVDWGGGFSIVLTSSLVGGARIVSKPLASFLYRPCATKASYS